MLEWSSTITLTFGGNHHEAENIREYIKLLKDKFEQDYNIFLNDDEITDIKYGYSDE
jgi:hypothetical protein